ncbi:hypothetical protein [Neobacillus sp.]|jgi:hypothetical protein|uniref:hypothetical protein n=1 Tax=Neobacillus sp. TaxID=2675273 RepID=UPI0035B50EA6
MEFSFSHFSQKVSEKLVSNVKNESGINYVLLVIQNLLNNEEIDFSRFTFEDLVDVLNGLEEAIIYEHNDGNIEIDPNHSYTRVLALSWKINKLGEVPRQRGTSPFLFL